MKRSKTYLARLLCARIRTRHPHVRMIPAQMRVAVRRKSIFVGSGLVRHDERDDASSDGNKFNCIDVFEDLNEGIRTAGSMEGSIKSM